MAPTKQFIAADDGAVCAFMKTITLGRHPRCPEARSAIHVTVPPEIAARARASLDRMVALGPGVARKPGD